jgi:hypothetical protein
MFDLVIVTFHSIHKAVKFILIHKHNQVEEVAELKTHLDEQYSVIPELKEALNSKTLEFGQVSKVAILEQKYTNLEQPFSLQQTFSEFKQSPLGIDSSLSSESTTVTIGNHRP